MVPHEKMIASYLQLRDKKNEVEARHKTELAKINEAIGLVEAWLKDHLMKNNLQRIGSKEATAFLKRTTKATMADSGVFREFVLSSGDFDLADLRPKKEAVELYITEHNGNPPPGVNFQSLVTVQVNRQH